MIEDRSWPNLCSTYTTSTTAATSSEAELNRVVREAVEKRIALVEIIPGKGSGQLKKHVLRFLNQAHIRALYHRVEKDDRNFGRIFVHFRHK